jgi:hypothetical protein
VLEVLEQHQLRAALAPRELLAATARTLVRAAKATGLPPLDKPTVDQYRKLRQIGHRVPGACTLIEIAMQVAPKRTLRSTANPEAAVLALREIARSLPADLATSVAEVDLARLEATIGFLEKWFEGGTAGASTPQQKLEKLTASGFFGVAFDEQALLRTALEAKVVGDVFPNRTPEVAKIRARVEALRDRSHTELESLLQKRADEAWAAVLG